MSIHQVFNDSLQRATADTGFLARFYELFLAASPLVREKFSGVDMTGQQHMLKASLYTLLLGVQGRHGHEPQFDEIARRHGPRDLAIPDELYDLWLECLLKSVAEFDPEYSAEVDAAWRSILTQGIDYMKRRGDCE